MTPAQVAHIMSLVNKLKRFSHPIDRHEAAEVVAAVEAALRDAPQAEGWVMVPVDVLKAASESLGSFVSDHGWGDADMQAMDNLDAYLAARPSAPTAVEPDERQPLTNEQIDEMLGEANRGFCIEKDDYFKAVRDTERAHGIAARASKGTPL